MWSLLDARVQKLRKSGKKRRALCGPPYMLDCFLVTPVLPRPSQVMSSVSACHGGSPTLGQARAQTLHYTSSDYSSTYYAGLAFHRLSLSSAARTMGVSKLFPETDRYTLTSTQHPSLSGSPPCTGLDE